MLIAAVLAAAAFAQTGPPARAVTDLDRRPSGSAHRWDLDMSPFVKAGANTFFILHRTDPITGRYAAELWRTDGTPPGTLFLRDLHPFRVQPPLMLGTPPASLSGADLGGRLLFAGQDMAVGDELWTSDGTVDGTELLEDVAQGVFSSWPRSFAVRGSSAFFAASALDAALSERRGVWRIDSGQAAAVLLEDVESRPSNDGPAYGTTELFVAGDRIFFTLLDAMGAGALWMSDGTPEMTRVAGSGFFGPSCRPVATSSTASFLDCPASAGNRVLWKTDGTSQGTAQLAELVEIGEAVLFGPTLIFVTRDVAHGRELWSSDGTPMGTQLFADVLPGVRSGNPKSLALFQGALFFTAQDYAGVRNLWRSDGTPQGTMSLAGLAAGTSSVTAGPLTAGGQLFFFEARDNGVTTLWSTDGMSSSSSIRDFQARAPARIGQAAGGGLLFALPRYLDAWSLWTSDGTAAGTVELGRLTSSVTEDGLDEGAGFASLGQDVLFLADDGAGAFGLWKSDGTAAGTEPVYTSTLGAQMVGSDGATVYFTEPVMDGYRLMRSDGRTASLLAVLPGLPNAFAVSGGLAYFFVSGALWRTDGTESGIGVLRPLDPGSSGVIVPFHGGAIFASPGEIWWTDGSIAGTKRLSTVPVGSPSSGVAVGGMVLLWIGAELWRTDGTPAGTSRVAVIGSALGSRLVSMGGMALFRVEAGPTTGLWRSDGTAEGTAVVFADTTLAPAYRGAFVAGDPVVSGGAAYFVAFDPDHGMELWRSDGTGQGTSMVKDIYPGPGSSRPDLLTDMDGTLVFSAYDGVHGREVWTSRGSAADTVLLSDSWPGPNSAGPASGTFVRAGDRIYFAGKDPSFGTELFSFPAALLGGLVSDGGVAEAGTAGDAAASAVDAAGGSGAAEAAGPEDAGAAMPGSLNGEHRSCGCQTARPAPRPKAPAATLALGCACAALFARRRYRRP